MAPDATGLALRQVLLQDCPLPSEPRPRGKGRRWGRPVLASSPTKNINKKEGGRKRGERGGQTPKDEKNKKHKIKRVKNKHGANCHSLHASIHTLSPSNSHSNSSPCSPFLPPLCLPFCPPPRPLRPLCTSWGESTCCVACATESVNTFDVLDLP